MTSTANQRSAEPLTSPATKEKLRQIMGHYATGATVVTASLDGVPHGLAVNSLTSVSLEPPLILFCPAKSSDTWPAIESAGHFAVNILGEGHDDLCRSFARKGADRFAGVSFTSSALGCPVLDDVAAYLECRIDQVHDAGDHFITVGRVLALEVRAEMAPLIFYKGGFHQLAEPEPAARSGG